MSKSIPLPAPHYYMFIEGDNFRESIKVSVIKDTALKLAERYFLKNRTHKVSVMLEKLDVRTGVRTFEPIWSSRAFQPNWNSTQGRRH